MNPEPVPRATADTPQPDPVGRVLVVDDSRVQRRILSALLARAGYAVSEAASGEEALEICRSRLPDIVISDWMMPGMSGIDLCGALRSMPGDSYTYFVLLTSKSESAEIARGLDGGADDFLTKPVNGDELRARIAAGERILRMERRLQDSNHLLSSALRELQAVYDLIDRDLDEARKLQQSLVRERHRRFSGGAVSLLLRPAGAVGGDLVGFIPIGERRVGLFSIDVSGHGITSALMTARIAGYLTGTSPGQNLALLGGRDSGRDPADLADQLNAILLRDLETETYFTMAYAEVDLATGAVRMVQAGHPHPMIQRASGRIEVLGTGGMPIGLFDGGTYETVLAKLEPGDRLLLLSDGVTEAEDGAGTQFGDCGLGPFLAAHRDSSAAGMLESLVWSLSEHSGGEMADDVSAAVFEFTGDRKDPV